MQAFEGHIEEEPGKSPMDSRILKGRRKKVY
jgi:hypothetical protein